MGGGVIKLPLPTDTAGGVDTGHWLVRLKQPVARLQGMDFYTTRSKLAKGAIHNVLCVSPQTHN